LKEPDEKYDCLKLGRQLCFPLYAASRQITRQYTPFLSELGITYTQYIALMVLWEKRPVTVKELGDALRLDTGTVTPLLKKMEKEGLITRTRSERDNRVVEIDLTDRGWALREKAVEVPGKMIRCGSSLTQEEAAELFRLLYKLMDGKKETVE